jgi:DNA-directed RNA polymerase subunit RPC12/RpoP
MEANTRYVCSDCGCDFTVHSGFGKPYCPYCYSPSIKEKATVEEAEKRKGVLEAEEVPRDFLGRAKK